MSVGHKADLVPSTDPECYFPADQRGRWLLFERERHEQVVVGPGHVNFSMLGSFICKSKHWRKEQYKTLSVYDNGWSVSTSTFHERAALIVLFMSGSRRYCDHSSLLVGSFVGLFVCCDFSETTSLIFMTFGSDIQHLCEISLLICEMSRSSLKSQEAQLLLGDRATRKHAKDC